MCPNVLISGEIERLANDSCWLEYDDMGVVKIASFNEKKSFNLVPMAIGELITKTSEEFFKETGSHLNTNVEIERYIHCGDYGAKVVLNIPQDDFGVCVWATVVDDVTTKIDHIGITDNRPGTCYGFVVGSMVGKVSEGVGSDFFDRLKAEKSAVETANFIIDGMRYVKVTLKKEYSLNLNEIMSELKEMPEFELIERESYTQGIGEFYKIGR